MELFVVDERTCLQDGLCAQVCPRRIIDFQKGSYPVPYSHAVAKCIACGHCVAVCPTASLSHRDVPVSDCPLIRDDLAITAEQCEQFLSARRAIRNYKNESVPRAVVTRLIEIASHAPSAMNNQCTDWLFVDERGELSRFSALVVDWMREMIKSEPEKYFRLDFETHVKNWENGIDHFLHGAPVLIVAHTGKEQAGAMTTCTTALAYFELAAFGFGLGCCQAGLFNMAATRYSPLIKKLNLPESQQLCGSLVFGYPKFPFRRVPARRSPIVTFH